MSLCTLPDELFDAVIELVRWPRGRNALLPLRATCRALDERLSDRIFSVRASSRARADHDQSIRLGNRTDLETHLADTLAVLASVGARLRVLSVYGGPGRTGGSGAMLQVLRRCPNVEALQIPADQHTLVGLLDEHLRRLQLLYLDCAAAVAPPPRMSPTLPFSTLPSLQSLALRRYQATASEAWALFSALACTAIDSINLQSCSVVVDMDVEAYIGEAEARGALSALACESADGVAAIVLAHFTVGMLGLAGGSCGVDQPCIQCSALDACGADTVAIDHCSTALLPTLASSTMLQSLSILLRGSSCDLNVVEALSAIIAQSCASAFGSLRTVFIKLKPDARSTYVTGDGDLLDPGRLERDAAALEDIIWAEIDRRAVVERGFAAARPDRAALSSAMSGTIQPSIESDVRLSR